MRAHTVLGRVSLVLLCPASVLTFLLYCYPFFLGCSFPQPDTSGALSHVHGSRDSGQPKRHAPFRLLALGDPQLEGDSSLPSPDDPLFPSLDHIQVINRNSGLSSDAEALLGFLKNIFRRDIPKLLKSYRKRLDLFGNDFYLAHIYRTLHWWLEPTHVAVLGDLIGSQWISDEEFEKRGSRYWNIVFRRGRRVDDYITGLTSTEPLGQDPAWSERVINVAGNHDIGYAGDLYRPRVERFERVFGKVNWNIKFHLPMRNATAESSGLPFSELKPELHLVILNNMNLDGPTFDPELQKETYEFINSQVINSSRPVEDRATGTVLLTHIPLHKETGVCSDGPFFDYGSYGVKEQNQLSRVASNAILEGIFGISGRPDAPVNGFGRNGVVLNGHDHVGCDVHHHIDQATEDQDAEWKASRWTESSAARTSEPVRGLREITVRSMMGSFGGNAGLLSAWFDEPAGEWRFEYSTCSVGVQHIWWAVHVLDLVTLACALLAAGLVLREKSPSDTVQSFKPPPPPQPKKSPLKALPNGNVVTKRSSHNSLRPKKSKNKLRQRASHSQFTRM